MKRFWLVASVLVLIAAPSWGSSIGVGVGYWDTEAAQDDNGFGLKFSLDAGSHWNLDLRAAFFDGHEQVAGVRRISIEATPIDAGVSYDFNPGSPATFYVGGGLNYTLFKSESFDLVRREPEQSRIKDEPGWYAVVGVEGRVTGGVGFFAEALYRQSKPTVQGNGLTEFDEIPIDFAGAAASVGISYSW